MILDRLKTLFGIDKTYEQRSVAGAEAKQLIENRHFREAFEALELQLVNNAMGTDPNDFTACQSVIISMQNLQGIRRELERKIQDGEIAREQAKQEQEAQRRESLRMVR